MKMNVNELDIGKIQVGQTVELSADALPGQMFLGTVEKVSINGTTTGGTVSTDGSTSMEKSSARWANPSWRQTRHDLHL